MSNRNKRKYPIRIAEPSTINTIDKEIISMDDYPVFCFKYLSNASIKKCNDANFFYDFLMRLRKLSELGWTEIRKSHRHAYGLEPIPLYKIKSQILPDSITPDVKQLHAFRATGNNLSFIGIQMQKVFRILFLEANFGDIYEH